MFGRKSKKGQPVESASANKTTGGKMGEKELSKTVKGNTEGKVAREEKIQKKLAFKQKGKESKNEGGKPKKEKYLFNSY